MPRSLKFQFGDSDLAFDMVKVDRAKLYGFKELEAVDDDGRPCSLATLAEDGRTLIGRGGTGIGYINADGDWCDKADLTPVDLEGEEIVPVASSFDAPIKLFDTIEVDDFLEYNVRLIYELKSQDSLEDLMAELDRGTIFSFPFSYRGGLQADAGFLISSQRGELFMLIGAESAGDFIGLQETAAFDEDESSQDEETDIMDFDMI